MFFVEESLKNLAGRSLKILRQFTNTPLKGVSVGIVITAILQSSSVVSLMVLAFVGAGIIQKLQMTHPYTAACSLHEFFKLLLEWQWALLYADNDEPAAQLASDVLDHFELHVDEVDSNEVVRDLMGLPDMQVAQYVKTGECALNQVTPEMPLSFKLWATTNQVMEEPRPILAQLYIDCVSYKNIEKDLGRL